MDFYFAVLAPRVVRRDTATGCSSKPSHDVTVCITDVCSVILYNWHVIFYSGQCRATLYIRVSFYHGALSRGAAPAYRVDSGLASYRTRTQGGDQWSSGGQNITTNSGQCGEIIMIRFICALSSVLWAPCPISPHYEGHYHAAPATICSLSDWNYLYKVRLATENNNLDVDIVDRMRVGCEYGNVCGCWLWWWLHCTIMIIARQGCARMTFSW